jgi:hypothetical protein
VIELVTLFIVADVEVVNPNLAIPHHGIGGPDVGPAHAQRLNLGSTNTSPAS